MKVSLEILLAGGEGQYVEYKSCFDRSKKGAARPVPIKKVAKEVARCLAAFANADGGTLLLGVEDDGIVTGLPYGDQEIESLKQIARDNWKRPVPYTFEMCHHSEGRIAIFEVDTQLDEFSLTDGKTPYRNKEQTVWFTTEEVRALKRTKASTLVERTLTSFSVDDLDPALIERFRQKAGASPSLTTEDLLIEYDLAVRNGSAIKLTLAACLLFGKPPMTRFHERAGVNFRRFDGLVVLTGPRNNERMDETRELPLPFLIEEVFKLVQSQIGVSRKLKDLFFEERPEYPTFAWQEAIVNAVAHRDYSLRGNEVEIRMFDDRLEVKNPGLPPEPVTIEDLQQRKQVHASRNPRIMRVLKAMGFVRERGEGLPRIFEETEESFLMPPEITADGRFFKITLRNTPVFDDETMRWLGQFPMEKLHPRQRRILGYCRQSRKGFFTLTDYVRENGIDKENAKKEIRQMLDLQVVELVGRRKAAKYYPLLQRGTIEERLREYFSRHEFLTNREYRRITGTQQSFSASIQLKRLVRDDLLQSKGRRKGTRYYPTQKLLKTK